MRLFYITWTVLLALILVGNVVSCGITNEHLSTIKRLTYVVCLDATQGAVTTDWRDICIEQMP